jgi:hypothetical protein
LPASLVVTSLRYASAFKPDLLKRGGAKLAESCGEIERLSELQITARLTHPPFLGRKCLVGTAFLATLADDTADGSGFPPLCWWRAAVCSIRVWPAGLPNE